MSIRGARSALVIVIEAIWGFAAAAVFVRIFSTERAGPSLIAVAAVVLGAAALGHVTNASENGARRLPIAGLAFSAVALFIIAQSEYAGAPWKLGWVSSLATQGGEMGASGRAVIGGVIVLALLWARGVGASARADDARSAASSIVFGLAAVALAAVISPPVHGPNLFGALALVYVPLALGALAMHQVTDPDRSLREMAAQSGRWLAVMTAVTLIAAIAASAIDPRSLGVLAPIGRPLLVAVGAGVTFVLAPVFAVLAAIVHLLPSPPFHQTTPQPAVQAPVIKGPHGTPGWQLVVGRAIAGAVIALLIVAGLALIWHALRRLAPNRRDAQDRRESIEDEQDLGDDLGDLFRGLLRRFRGGQRAPATSIAVRRLYHEMLADAAASGIERRPSLTPLQFAPQLDAHYASDAPTAISGAFSRSRYGRAEFDEATVTELRRRWQAARSVRAPHPP